MTSFYKYVTAERTDILERGAVRFSQVGALNDPFEMRPFFTEILPAEEIAAVMDLKSLDIRESMREQHRLLPAEQRAAIPEDQFLAFAEAYLRENPAELSEMMAAIRGQIVSAVEGLADWSREEMHSKSAKLVGILCLSEIQSDPLMWAHYAQQHEGLVLEFDGESGFFDQRRTPDDDHYVLRPVNYPVVRPTYRSITELNRESVYLTKGHEWQYEREHRMSIPLSLHPPLDESAALPVHLITFPPAALLSVTLGARSSESLKVRVRQILGSNSELRHVSVAQAELSLDSGRIVVRPVSG